MEQFISFVLFIDGIEIKLWLQRRKLQRTLLDDLVRYRDGRWKESSSKRQERTMIICVNSFLTFEDY